MNAINLQQLHDAERELSDALMLPTNNFQQTELRFDRIKVKAENLAHVASLALAHLRADNSGCVK